MILVRLLFRDGTYVERDADTPVGVDHYSVPLSRLGGHDITIDGRPARVETTEDALRRQLADETTRANLAERSAMAWEGRAKAAERALTTTDADRVVAMAAAEVRANAWKRMALALEARRCSLPNGTWERCQSAAAALVAIGEPNILSADYVDDHGS